MALDLTYKANGKVFCIRFSMADWETIEQIKSHLPNAVSACFGVRAFGESVTIPLETLRASVEQIDALLGQHPELLPYTYQFKFECMEGGEQPVGLSDRFDTGGQSGFRLPGDEDHWYAIWAGLNKLRLDKMGRQPDGSGKTIESRDLRGEKELITADAGRFQFRKRRAKTSLRKGLQEMRAFLVGVTGPDVMKILG
jgi:hypothetical protein